MIRFTVFAFLTIFTVFTSCADTANNEDWKSIQPGTLGISVEMPYELAEKDMAKDLPPAAMQRIEKIETFFHEGKNRFYGVNVVEYKPSVTVSMPAAIKGALTEMARKSQGTISNQQDREEIINGNNATITTATILNEKKVDMDLQMLLISKDSKMYQVMGVYKSGNRKDKEITERIIKSVKISK